MKDRVQEVIDKAITAQGASHLCMMLGSAFAANQAIFLKMTSEGYSTGASALAAVLVAVIVAGFVDGTLKGWLPFTLAGLVGKKDRKTGVERYAWFNWTVRILTLILLFVTTYLNVGLTPDIVDKTVGEVNTSEQDSRTARVMDRYTKDLSIYENELNDATARLNGLEKGKKVAVAELIASKSNIKVADLWAKGNSWVYTADCKGCASAIKSAQRQVDKDITEAKKAKADAKTALSAFMSTTGATTDQVVLTANNEITKAKEHNQESKETWTSLMMVIMVVSTIVFIGATLIIVLYEEETGEDTSHRATAGNILKGVFGKTKNGLTKAAVKIFGLDKITVAPTLAGVDYSVRISSTQSHRAQKDRTQHRDTERSTERTQNTGKKSCSVSQKEVRETQNKTELSYTEPNTERVLYSDNGRGKEWPTPDNVEEWKKLVKKARLWPIQADEAQSEETRKRNREKWELFVRYAARFGYRAGIGEAGKPFVNNHAEPVWSDDDHQVVWNIGEGGDFDQPSNDN